MGRIRIHSKTFQTMTRHNNTVFHTERSLKKVGKTFEQFRCSPHK